MSKVDHQKLVDFLSFRPRTFVVRMGWSNQGRKKERTLYGSSRRSGMTLVTSTSDEQEQHAIVLVALVVLVVLVVIVTSRTIFTISIARTTGTTLLALLALVVLVLVLLLVLIEFKLSTRPSDMQAKTVPLSCRRRLFDIVAFGNLPPSTLCSLTFNFLLRWVDASAAGMGCLRMDELSRLLGLAGADVDCLSYMCALRVCALCDGVSEKKKRCAAKESSSCRVLPLPYDAGARDISQGIGSDVREVREPLAERVAKPMFFRPKACSGHPIRREVPCASMSSGSGYRFPSPFAWL